MTYDEEHALAQVAQEAIKEIRARRRWKIVFRLITLFIFLSVIWQMVSFSNDVKNAFKLEPHVAVVEVHGVITAAELANSNELIESLTNAFTNDNVLAVILDINSPGGSPVQSGQVYRAIMDLKETYDKPIYAIISDAGASGAYYIASAADEIYADPASIVGSIGVIAQSLGYEALADNIGIDPRTFTAGKYKDFLSGSRELKPEEVKHMQTLLIDLHQQFIDAVKEGRGDRLNTEYEDLFSGLFWTGKQSVDIGLIDGLSSLYEFKNQHYPNVELVIYSPELSPWALIARDMGVQLRAQFDQWLNTSQQVDTIQFK